MALANEDVAAFVDVELELLALGEPWDSKLAFWSSTLWGYKRALGSAVGGELGSFVVSISVLTQYSFINILRINNFKHDLNKSIFNYRLKN